MFKAAVIGGLFCSVVIFGHFNIHSTKVNANETEFKKNQELQSQVTPIIDGEIIKFFKENKTINNVGTNVPNYEEFSNFATIYYDNEKSQVVFNVIKNTSEMKQIEIDLTDKLGSKVKFTNAKHSFKELEEINTEIFEKLKNRGDVSTGIDTKNEVVNIHANLSIAEEKELVDLYGDTINILPSDGIIETR
ncbi:hypothetical protein ACFO9Q_18730 [Paenibacillus sp. GCM10023252]|uniref:hypothetical protein n=1 Tax=Paenibacillus sp. GCM10023252 TaxID=3252649 RepID=UPI003612E145